MATRRTKRTTRRRRTRRAQTRRRNKRVRFALRGGGDAPTLYKDAYAITMPEFPERFQRIKAYATAAGVPLQPFPGVRITPQQRDTLPPLGVGTTHYKDRTGATFNLGVIGAFLAHRNLLRHIAKRPAASAGIGTLIFEDDVVIPPDFHKRLAAIAPEVPADWDILFLDKFRQEGRMVSPHIMKLERDMTAMKNWGIWAFIVRNASVAKKILPTMEHMLDVPDIQLNKFAHQINMYLVQPALVQPDQATAGKSVVTQLDQQRGGGGAPSPLKVFVYANLHTPPFQALYDSLRRGGYEVKLLGQGQPWRGFQERMRVYQAAAAAEPADSLVAFLDGYDSLAILSATQAVEKFRGRPRPSAPILFSAEPVCLNNCAREQLAWFDSNPATKAGTKQAVETALQSVPDRPNEPGSVIHRDSTPVFLNAGAVIGQAGALAALYQDALATGDTDDQRALGKVLATNPGRADLDVEGAVFRTKLGERAKAAEEGTPTGPAFLHFPGVAAGPAKEETLLRLFDPYAGLPVKN